MRKPKDFASITSRISDKYVLQKFVKEFEKVLTFVYVPTSDSMNQETSGDIAEMMHEDS